MERGLIVLAMILSSVTIAACSRPSPEKACAHEAELSPLVAERECVEQMTEFRVEEPEKFDNFAKCVLDSKNVASLGSCTREFHPGMYQPAPVDEGREGVTRIIELLGDRYKESKSLCPSARQGDPGWSCLSKVPGAHVQPPMEKMFLPSPSFAWTYEFRTEGQSVTAYARGRGKGRKKIEISKTAEVRDGALVVAPGYEERDL